MESTWSRAFGDSKKWLLDHFVSWFLAFLLPGGGTLLVTWLLPPNADLKESALLGFLGGLAGLLLLFIGTYILNLLRAPYRQRDEIRILLLKRPKPMPLQDKGKLLGAIYDAKTAAIEFIDCRRELARLYEQNPNDIDKDKAEKVLKDSQMKYTEAHRLLEREKLVVGYEYEPFLNSFIMFMQIGVDFWDSRVSGEGDFLITFKSLLEANVKETINHIDRINQQN